MRPIKEKMAKKLNLTYTTVIHWQDSYDSFEEQMKSIEDGVARARLRGAKIIRFDVDDAGLFLVTIEGNVQQKDESQ